ncbi:MAG TPA: pitrilysin family protein [Terriglobales bacterium]|nr:pitrilysin family protein [Terriglobales bacterium]
MRRTAVGLARLALLLPLLASPAAAVGPQMTRTVLPNGVILIVSEQRAVPMAVVQVLLDAGARRDPAGKEGVAYLTADLLTEGTESRSAPEIAAAIDRIGASLESSSGVDSAFASLKVLSKHLDTGLDLLTDVLLHPSFPAAEVERRREAVLAAMKAAEDQPGHVASRRFTELLFAQEPYGHSADGMPESVAKITRADLLDFYRANYRPSGTIVTVVGDVDAAQIRADFESRLSAWSGSDPRPFEYGIQHPDRTRVVTIPKPVPQASLVLGHRGISRDNPDYYAVTVMNYVLGGGGFGSRLMDEIRTKSGLAYSVGSGFTAPKSPGSFRIEMQTKTATVTEALQRTCAQLERIRAGEVTADELDSAKRYLTGSFPLQFDSNSEIASFLTTVEFYGLGPNYAADYVKRIEAVSREDVQRVARTYVRPKDLLLVVAGNVDPAQLPAVPCP